MEPRDRQSDTQRRRLAALCAAALSLAVVAIACHQGPPANHLWSQHYNQIFPTPVPEFDEPWCVDLTSEFAPPAPPDTNPWVEGDRIRTALTGNPAEDWQDAAGLGRINFVLLGGCDEFTQSTTPRRSDIHIEYHLTPSTFGTGCNTLYPDPAMISCVYRRPEFLADWGDGHTDYKKVYVLLDTDDLSQHVINHETGHVLGLGDPIEGWGLSSILTATQLQEPAHCRLDLFGDILWVESIMHSAHPDYCDSLPVEVGPAPSYLLWPSRYDRDKVTRISDLEDPILP